ncbi:MAG: sodium:calcium antiporter [Minisyncoccales bacterium]
MIFWQNIILLFISFFLLTFSAKLVVQSLLRIAQFLGWKEFVAAFLLAAMSNSIPNLFVGIVSALNKIPELSFGDVVGGNIIEIALLGGLAALISRNGLSTQSRTVQGSTLFATLTAILPLILAGDGIISRGDGILLICFFLIYLFWLFKKKERFEKTYDGVSRSLKLSLVFKNFLILAGSVFLLLLSAQGVVNSAIFFAGYFHLPVFFIGIFIVALGNNLPDLFFVLQSAKKNQDWLILGDLMGGVVITVTLVLGAVALIQPIKTDISIGATAISRIFLAISGLFFLFFIRSGKRVNKKEGIILITICLLFFLLEILNQIY